MTYDDLAQKLDDAERLVHELSQEQELYDEDSPEWLSFVEEINDAENEVSLYQERIDIGDYQD